MGILSINKKYKINTKNIFTKAHRILFTLTISGFLSACGGGFSDSFTGTGTTGVNGNANEAPPTASSVKFVDDNGGNVEVGDTLTGSYIYDDVNGDAEGKTLFRWYSDGVAISTPSAVTDRYTVENSDLGTEITFGVAPVALSGNLTLGSEVISSGTTVVNPGSVLDASHFRSLISTRIINCTLSNGSVTQCHELKFSANNIIDGATSTSVNDASGPFCPKLRTDANGGLGIYDGVNGPGLQQLAQTLWDNMAAAPDLFDLIDNSDNVCTFDNNTMTQTNGVQTECNASCLVNTPDDTITVVYNFPVVPEDLGSTNTIGALEPVGASLDGIPITGMPPSVTAASGNINALDGCGGHHDATGYYHLHFIPEATDAVLTSLSITGIDCASKITQSDTALTGYAGDGYPIYSRFDQGAASVPGDLDACNGHTGATPEFPAGVYHYHASETAVPNTPPCLKGASVSTPVTPSFE